MTMILGMDTATVGCSVALIRDETCLASRAERMLRGQSEALAPMIDAVMRDAGVGFDAIDAVAVTRGPGAFTGLRIGLAAARATALALGRPCLGIGTFDVLAAQALEVIGHRPEGAPAAEAMLIAIDSKRDDLFICLFDMLGRPLAPPASMPPAEIQSRLGGYSTLAVAGDAAVRASTYISSDVRLSIIAEVEIPDAAVVASLGFGYLQAPETAPASPLYLRAPDVSPGPAKD